MKSKYFVYGVAIFSVAMIVAVWIGGKWLVDAKGQNKTLSVVGMAQRDFTSDLIVWDLAYSDTELDMQDGYREVKEMSEKVKDFLAKHGISDEEVEYEPVSSSRATEYYYDEARKRSYYKFVGYEITQRIHIESNEVDKVEKASREISDLIGEGIDFDRNSIEYYYTKLSDLKIEMLKEAAEDARNRAKTIAKNSGARLGRLQSANMGVFQITAPNSSDEDFSWGGAFNTSSKKKRASINMRLKYEVK